MQHCFLKQWSSQYVLICSRTYRIESKCSKHIPCRGLSVVFIPTIAVRSGRIHSVHHFPQPVLCLPWLTCIVIQVYHVLYRLVSMCIVTHIHYSHLTNFVYHLTVIAFVEQWRYRENRVKHNDKLFLASHQINQSLRIVEYRP